MPYKENKIKNIFTIDTEDWFHANYEDDLFTNTKNIKTTVEENTEKLLQIFEKRKCTATFFVLGFVAEQHPDLVKKIYNSGHEIASHGYGHQLVYKQTPKEFREDIKKSKILLEDIIGDKILGYRAPSWSITGKSFWALEVLTEEDFKYDSSIFPFENFLYGVKDAPRFKYNTDIYNKNSNLVEIPPTTIYTPLVNVPFSGGFYFRVLPKFVIIQFSKMINMQGKETIFYLHPREIDYFQPRLNLNRRDAFIHYYGIKSCQHKLEGILDKHLCITIKESLNL